MIANSPSRGRSNRGFGLIELSIAAVMLAAAMVATVQVVSWVALDRRAVERRERAVVEASNILERITARPWDELETEKLATIMLAEPTAACLPGGSLDIKASTIEGPPARKKLAIEIRWRDRSGRTESPVRIVTWVYRRGELPR